MKNLSISEQLCYITARIECKKFKGGKSTGTGFFFAFNIEGGDGNLPVVVTNKHVVEDAAVGALVLTVADDDGNPADLKHIKLEMDSFEDRWIMHPDGAVDLCVMPLAPFIHQIEEKIRDKIFYKTFRESDLLGEILEAELNPLEEVTMIGYPNGIWDTVNNMPVFRRGITATSPLVNYNGRQEFLIDIAALPGSSGSPVMILNENVYTTREGNSVVGSPRMVLLGILSSGPQRLVQGELHPKLNGVDSVPILALPINLGIVIKAHRILDFKPLLMLKNKNNLK